MTKLVPSIIATSAVLLSAARLAAETVTASGTIQSVDAGGRSMTVRRKTAKGEKTASFAVAPEAQVVVDGEPRDLASLKAGQSVTISYDTVAKQITAIRVGSALPPTASEQKAADPLPPDDAVAFEGHSYKFFREVMTWRQAKQRCEKLGGHLATIGSEAENDFVLVLAKSGISKLGDLDGIWLGATDERQEGDWRWLDGEKVVFNKWGPGQPNNKQGAEHYLLLWLSKERWADQPDRSKQHVAYFVCEWDAARSSEASATPAADHNDMFQAGTVWVKDDQGGRSKLTVLTRRGETFTAKFELGNGLVRQLKGTVKDGRVSWLAKDVRSTGRPGGDNDGLLSRDERGEKIDFVWNDQMRGERKSTSFGTISR
ncbi:MAG TPA: lectin-like protein [Pirellulales bacterium]|nr:lectin-like protein [Pirellulales bacterium]